MKIQELIENLRTYPDNWEVELQYNTDSCSVKIGDIVYDKNSNSVIIEGLNEGLNYGTK